MNKLLTAVAAAAIGFGMLGAGAAGAQPARTVVVEQHVERHHYTHRQHARRVCNTVWRHHRRVQRCRTVWR